MAIPRFFIEKLAAGVVELDECESGHARRSRRLSAGDAVALFDGGGHEAVGRIVSGADRRVVYIEVGEIQFRRRPAPELTLAVAIPKGPRQDWLIEKCTELGVAAIWPVLAKRSVCSASEHKLHKWRRTMVEAAKQSQQCYLPALMEPRRIDELACDFAQFDRVWVAASPAEQRGQTVQPVLRILADSGRRLLAFIGPEGGWSSEEMDALIEAGAQPMMLGSNTLRIETAAAALAAIVHGAQCEHGPENDF